MRGARTLAMTRPAHCRAQPEGTGRVCRRPRLCSPGCLVPWADTPEWTLAPLRHLRKGGSQTQPPLPSERGQQTRFRKRSTFRPAPEMRLRCA